MAKHALHTVPERVTYPGRRLSHNIGGTSPPPRQQAQDTCQIQWPNAVSIIAVAETAMQHRWAASVAVALTQRLSRLHQNVVLVDFCGPNSVLSSGLSVRNEEGITDVLIRGVPFSKIARRPKRHSFYFLPASSKPSPPAYRCGYHDWEGIANRFRHAKAFLAIYTPAEQWREQGPIPGFESAIIINALNRQVHLDCIDKIGEIAADIAQAALDANENNFTSDGWADTEHVQIHTTPRSTRSRVPKPIRVRGPRSGRLRSRLLTLMSIAPPLLWLALSLDPAEVAESFEARTLNTARYLAARVWPTDVPPVAFAASANVTLPASAAPTLFETKDFPSWSKEYDVVRPSPKSTIQNRELSYSVQIAAYDRLELAVQKQRDFSRPNLSLFIAPIPRSGGKECYRLLAGPFPDLGKAKKIMASLVTSGLKDTASEWDIRPTRYAFAIQKFSDLTETQQEITKLLKRGIPAYWVRVARLDEHNGVSYQIYAGGYEFDDEASTLRKRINEAGLDATLVPLMGLPIM